MAVLYANTELGRRAKNAFRAAPSPGRRDNYLPLVYPLPASDARNPLRQVLDKRPEDIAQVFAGLHRVNAASTPYEPIMFAAIDSHFASPEVDDLCLVSVTPANNPVGEGGPQHVDITSLAYDTTRLVLALYVYKGEASAISYDSVLAALIIAFAPIAALRTNFFETASGKQIGLGKLCEGLLQCPDGGVPMD